MHALTNTYKPLLPHREIVEFAVRTDETRGIRAQKRDGGPAPHIRARSQMAMQRWSPRVPPPLWL
jgi:hypothetical protein